MKPWLKALVLSTCFSALTAGSCGKRTVQAIPIPPERIDCAHIEKRPAISPEYRIDWGKVGTVAQARSEHDRFVASIRTREGVVAGYLLDVEGRLFACSNDAAWLRDWQASLK